MVLNSVVEGRSNSKEISEIYIMLNSKKKNKIGKEDRLCMWSGVYTCRPSYPGTVSEKVQTHKGKSHLGFFKVKRIPGIRGRNRNAWKSLSSAKRLIKLKQSK